MRLCLLSLLLAGCGYGPSVNLACTDLAQARCNRRASCSNGFDVNRTFGDMATCVTRETQTCVTNLQAPGTGTTTLTVEHCAEQYPSIACSDVYTSTFPPDCASTGSGSDGAPCSVNAQCESGFCSGTRTSLCGTCAPPPPVGASCLSSNCGRGQVCLGRTQTCQTLGTVGMSCDADAQPCTVDLACIGSAPGKLGVCMAGIPTYGAPCGGTLGACDNSIGLSCAGVTPVKTCSLTAIVGDGQPCGQIDNGGYAACGGDGICYGPSGVAPSGTSGICKAAAVDGGACDTSAGPPCLLPARCVTNGGTTGVCTLPGAACH